MNQLTVEVAPEALVYIDPFSDRTYTAEEMLTAHEIATKKYLSGEIEHDSRLDEFLRESEELVWTARYQDRMQVAETIMANVHMMCGDHQAVQSNERYSELFGQKHEHSNNEHSSMNHDHADEETRTGKKKKRSERRLGRFVVPRLSMFSAN